METFITEKRVLHRANASHLEGLGGPIAGPSTLQCLKCQYSTRDEMALTAYLYGNHQQVILVCWPKLVVLTRTANHGTIVVQRGCARLTQPQHEGLLL